MVSWHCKKFIAHGDVYCFVCSMNGVLEFVDASDVTVMAQTEHFMATDVEWDPTGRYVVSAVSWWGHKVSGGISSCATLSIS